MPHVLIRRQHRSTAATVRHNDTIDEEVGKGKGPQNHLSRQIYAPLRRLCVNPSSSFATSTLCSRPNAISSATRTQPPSPRGRHRVVQSLLVLLFAYGIISWSPRTRRQSLRYDSYQSLESMPLMIDMFDCDFHTSRWFHSVTSLEPLKLSNTPNYDGLVFLSLRNASLSDFRRQIALDDYMANEVYRKEVIIETARKEMHTDDYYQYHEEILSLECQRQNWQGLYFPNCNDFHEFDLGRDYNPMTSDVDHLLGYYDSFRFR